MFLIPTLPHSFYCWLIYILQFYCNIYFIMRDPTSIETETLQQQLHLPINFKSDYTWLWIECSETCTVVLIKYSCVDWSHVGLGIGKYAGGGNITVQERCEGINPWDFFLWLINHCQWTSMYRLYSLKAYTLYNPS